MDERLSVNREPIPGYRLLEPLGKGGFGEVWKCQAPGGMLKAIKFVAGSSGLHDESGAEQEFRALERIKTLRHPFLLSLERVERIRSDLVIVTELADRSLHDLFEDYRKGGQPGIPRGEVIAYLRETAEVLDFLNQDHGLQHLDIKPRNLFLVGRHIKVGDFGLVASLAEIYEREDLLGAITPLYAAPEIFEGRATLFSDQYSLAATFQELVTGSTPHTGKNVCQLAVLVATAAPDLSRLRECDQPVVARALSKDPRERFPSCTAFVEALVAAAPPSGVHRACNTAFEFNLGDQTATSVVPTVRTSGIYKRQTRVVPAGQTQALPSTEPLAGYQLQECLGRGPTGELWRARDPRDVPRYVRFLTPPEWKNSGPSPLDRVLMITHARMARAEVMAVGPDRVAVVSEAGESSLGSRLKEARAAGQPGIPRADLLAYFAVLAEALDELYHHHQMQHLTLTPRHLGVKDGQPLLLEFGLAEVLWLPAGIPPATLAPRYAALEMFDGLVSDACDQYSLGLLYQELLVGLHPYRNLNARQMASPKLRGEPDLSLLPAPDRAVVRQALEPDPANRFRSCTELVMALEDATRQIERGSTTAPVVPSARVSQPIHLEPAVPPWRAAVEELVQAASRGHQVLTEGLVHYRLTPGAAIEHRGWARLVPGMAKLKLAGFREHWQAGLVEQSAARWRLEIRTKGSLFERCLGRTPGVHVEIVLGNVREAGSSLTPVRVTIEPVDCGRGRGGQVLTELGPPILTSLQTYLNTHGDMATQESYPLTQSVELHAAGGLTIPGQLRTVSRQGVTVRTTADVPLGAATVTLNRWASPVTVRVNGWVRDCLPDEGQYDIEVTFG